MRFELGSGYSVSHETANFLGFEARKRKRWARSFDFSAVIREWSFFYSNVFPALAASMTIYSRYVSLILVLFLLRGYYSSFLFVLMCIRVVESRCSHQRCPVILARLLTVFSFLFVSVFFLFMIISHSRTLIWENLTFLDDWTFVMWSFMIFQLAWSMDLVRSWSMFLYSSMDFWEGGNVCRCARSINCWRRLFSLVINMSFDVYFFWSLIWSSLSLLSAGTIYGDLFHPNAILCEIFIQSSLWSVLGLSWKGRYPPWEVIMPYEAQIP